MTSRDRPQDETLAYGDTLVGYDRWAPHYDVDPNAIVAATSWVLDRTPLGCADADVLGLGCGTGRHARRVISEGARSYLGLDGSQGMLAVASQRHDDPRIAFASADLLGSWAVPKQFDFALIVLVLEHLSAVEPLLVSLARALKPGGRARIIYLHPERIETAHSMPAWFCGFAALPTVWKTLIPDERGVLVPLALVAGEVALIVVGWRTQRMWLGFLGLALGIAQFVGTLAISNDRAHEAITFGGDGGAMVLGTLLMASFYVPRFAAGGLRWGFLVIGAAAFVDTFATWWSARTNPDVIPLGEIEGVGSSDPARLLEDFSWNTPQP